ncbi:HET-domain-containing protein [Epithele typhae]|uniref:HET-domain-containing protein n=1 Tax=Epithele typhae TaxID=378194 RepID=UPI0020088DFF|nr:HET-domain-containing protein [Epithele typhae]KAH9935168.1 HET-domain-containing protein [Epithele typhae]
MWLLDTARAELHFFSEPGAVYGGYGALSHTWSQDPAYPEQSFQDLQTIIARCKETGANPRDVVCDKIRMCCITAEHDGYEWVWIDTCCIDKTSSTELSEAINSMFNWYVLCEVCYAFLDDVSSDDDPEATNSQFRRSRWHTRGWTLQELLAPAFVLFMSKDWKTIGNKHQFAQTLEDITRIGVYYLTRDVPFFDASIAVKMSWAAKRETTRVEDEAYSLFGLFNVTLPTLYGEGRQAFFRLQVELSRVSLDTTLFVWGGVHTSKDDTLPPDTLKMVSRFGTVPRAYLFAPSPEQFTVSDCHYTPKLQATTVLQPYNSWQWTEEHEKNMDVSKRLTGPFGSVRMPSFQLTSRGMKCHFPIADVGGITIMVLLVETLDQHLGMILHPAKEDSRDSGTPVFYVSWAFNSAATRRPKLTRLAQLGGDLYNLKFRGSIIMPVWRDVYIRAWPEWEDLMDAPHNILRLVRDNPSAPFRVPRWIVVAFTSLGLGRVRSDILTSDEDASFAQTFSFSNPRLPYGINVKVGLCKRATDEQPMHWALAAGTEAGTWGRRNRNRPHDCATEHVDDWQEGRRSFGDAERTVLLSFKRDAYNAHTRVLHIELHGTVYDDLQRLANVWVGRKAPSPSQSLAAASAAEAVGPPRAGAGGVIDEQTSRRQPTVPHATDATLAAIASRVTGAEVGLGSPADQSFDVIGSLRIDPRRLERGGLSQSDIDALKLQMSKMSALLESLRPSTDDTPLPSKSPSPLSTGKPWWRETAHWIMQFVTAG